MARTLERLTISQCVAATATKRKLLNDGGGLGLQITAFRDGSLGKSRVLRYTYQGKPRTLGLGAFPLVSLKDARQHAAAARELVGDGVDPILRKVVIDHGNKKISNVGKRGPALESQPSVAGCGNRSAQLPRLHRGALIAAAEGHGVTANAGRQKARYRPPGRTVRRRLTQSK